MPIWRIIAGWVPQNLENRGTLEREDTDIGTRLIETKRKASKIEDKGEPWREKTQDIGTRPIEHPETKRIKHVRQKTKDHSSVPNRGKISKWKSHP